MVFKAFLILICGMPWGHFLFKKADIWHAQGHFFQIGLLIIFCLSLFERPRCVQVMNKPLGIFTLWAGLVTSYWWFALFTKNQHYPVKVFFPFFNLLCFVWFYKLSIEYLDRKNIKEILKWLRYSVLFILIYCGLQYFKLDEFFNGLSGHDEIVGTIGNSSHLAGYLAIIQPIYFKKSLLNILSLILLWLVILSTDSASGLIVGLAVVLFYLLLKKRFAIFGFLTVIFCAISGFCLYSFPMFFSDRSRIEIWKTSFNVFKNHLITGLGLGSFRVQGFQLGAHWGHTHNEYYQISIELGLIGLVLLLWCLIEYFKLFNAFRTDLTIILGTIFFGFCILGLFTFDAHLWQIATIGMFSYSGLFALKNEVIVYENQA